ncbi:Cytochrome c oxidase assembly protein PET191, partial [Dillenia turbinata]
MEFSTLGSPTALLLGVEERKLRKSMSKSCKGLAMELVKCLSETPCIQEEKRSYRECAGEKSPSISSECVGLRETYFNCKRGQACYILS